MKWLKIFMLRLKENSMSNNFIIALAGNPNCGKSSIFNNLTGANQHIGNWPGVTVEKKTGHFEYQDKQIEVVDLPGIYSLSASSLDEKVARDFLVNEKPDVVVCIIDSSNFERNFYLVTQLLEMGVNLVLDLNMIDVMDKKGITINENMLSLILNVPVVKTIANKNRNIEMLKKAIIKASDSPKRRDFKIEYNQDLEKSIQKLISKLSNKNISENLRWAALTLLEGDRYLSDKIKKKYQISDIEKIVLSEVTTLEQKYDDDILTIMADNRYGYIKGLVNEVIKHKKKISRDTSDKIDNLVLNKFLGIPIFLLMMYVTFQLVFTLGGPLVDATGVFFNWLGTITAHFLTSLGMSSMIVSFIQNGLIGGVGSVLVFLPNILIMFLLLAFLGDSGYMARAAFVMDKFMHSLGLHGKSFIPMILGFGCNVPAIMATRTLESRKDRILTIMAIPYMSCSARLPIYVLFTSIFFPKYKGLIVFSLYILGIIVAIFVSKVTKALFFKKEVAPLIMELPPYRWPQAKSILLQMWLKSRAFLYKAGTIIFFTVIVIWALSSFPTGVVYASSKSWIGKLGIFITPIFKPAGFGFWQASVALTFGILAKEVVVGIFGTLFGGNLTHILPQYFTQLSALAFLVTSLIYVPCIATIAAIKRELNWKWAGFSTGVSLFLGWLLAVLVYQLGTLLKIFFH